MIPPTAPVPAPRRLPQETSFPRAATLSLVAIASLMVLAALQELRSFAIPTVLALLAAVALEPVARRADKIRIPRSLSAAVIVLAAIGGIAALVYYVLPSADEWNRRAPDILRKLDELLRNLISDLTDAIQGPQFNSDGEEIDPMEQLTGSGQSVLAGLAVSVPVFLSGTVYGAVLTFFLLRERALLARWVMALGTNPRRQRALGRAIRDIQSNVSSYLFAILLINTALGLVATALYWAFGIPNPFLWGLLTGVLNFMPYIGPAIMAMILLGVGLVTFPEPQSAFLPVLCLLVLNTVEGQFVTPMLVGRQMRQSALTIFLAITFGAWLWGAAGAILATPVLLVASAFTRRRPLVVSDGRSDRARIAAYATAPRAQRTR
ncbi:MAG: AI-2E family transporter [Paracoccaceae bacterium]|uniref:AI-2E family transporter n=1 Tax=Seohaeicola saemankumensis TaxID=481181 RepID=UPI001E2A6615|nr:AI-2E family transporter [Seohaeicola saemankumensis]MCD1627591.1 AI-2E family transporter [Seohaeicola saemankumensis]